MRKSAAVEQAQAGPANGVLIASPRGCEAQGGPGPAGRRASQVGTEVRALDEPPSLNVDGDLGGEEPLVRPFLDHVVGVRGGRVSGHGDVPAEVRPYLLTGGRTTTDVPHLAAESIVVSGAIPDRLTGRLRTLEHDAILAECDRARSVAELSALRGIPLRVALVLVGDLASAGLLETSTSASPQVADIHLLHRLIDGLTAL